MRQANQIVRHQVRCCQIKDVFMSGDHGFASSQKKSCLSPPFGSQTRCQLQNSGKTMDFDEKRAEMTSFLCAFSHRM
jgi:hypothetical protein